MLRWDGWVYERLLYHCCGMCLLSGLRRVFLSVAAAAQERASRGEHCIAKTGLVGMAGALSLREASGRQTADVGRKRNTENFSVSNMQMCPVWCCRKGVVMWEFCERVAADRVEGQRFQITITSLPG